MQMQMPALKGHYATPLRIAMHLVIRDIRPSIDREPFNIIHIPGAHKLTGQQLPRGTREARHAREALRPGGLAVQDGRHAADILIPQVAAGPRRRARGRGRQAREDVELARAAERRAGVEDEVQLAGLAGGAGGDVEGRERGDVADAAVLEDLAGAGVEVDGAGPDGVLRDGGWHDGVAGGDGGLGEGGGEAEDGGGDGCGEELHFDYFGWLDFKGKRL